MKLPEKIYLQKNTTTDLYEEVWPEWFETRSSDDDVEYIRADVLHNKIALKFNVGDYVVLNGKNVYQIIEIDMVSQRYECKNNMDESLSVPFSCDFTLRKWTIQDAKDNDVLVSGDVIFIFNKIHGVWVNCYCSWHKDGSFWKKNEDLMHIKYAETIHPATNEQRELLFQKIKNEGYEWDSKNKKLKIIEQKPEPKFKVRDWIANGGANPCYVKSIFGDYYELCSCEGFEYTKHIIDVNYIYHLWTITDANVGDVLVDEDNNIGLYSGEKDDLYWHSCIYLGCDGYIRGGSRIGGYHKYNNTKPATEEQRDMLFNKIKEVGFEWNAEKKELKKIEPKFKVRDWCIDKQDGTIFRIEKVMENTYKYKTDKGNSYSCTHCSLELDSRLWTIADAKCGDVLAINWNEDDDSWEKIIIFKKYHNNGVKGLYSAPCVEGYGNTFKNGKLAFQEEVPYYSETWTANLHPATKEQRDLLFQKIADAGCYEWDAEKKKLKKIEQKTVDKIEPKFHEGDYIVPDNITSPEIWKVINIDKDGYYNIKPIINIINSEYDEIYRVPTFIIENDYRLWTIDVAKDGDVLVTEDYIFIFKCILHGGVHLYCHYNFDDEEFDFDIQDAVIGNIHDKGMHFRPATEKQRDLLFQKINEAGYEWNCENKELKMIEQNTVDKVESKFHEGDWITDGYIHCKITEILDDRYIIESKYAKRSAILFEHENRYHLWTIKDAKDGDVLTTDNFIFIFKSIDNNNGVHYYCHYEISKHEDDSPQFGVALPQSLMGTVGSSFTHYKPATKEQHNLLFQKMKEAGYEWRSENKELKMKILFLDFDGVITTRASHWKIDFDKLALISYLCEKTGTKIVVTSSWRIGYNGDVSYFNESLTQYFNKNNYSYNFYPLFETFIKNIVGMTDSSGSCRGDEIKRWLDEHDDVDNYVILDDDSDMLDEQLLRFVQTDTYEGITDREVAICIDILNGIEVINPIRMNDELKFRWRLKCRYPDTVNNIKDMLEQYRNKFKH